MSMNLTKEAKTWLVIAGICLFTLVSEMITVLSFGYPISHALHDSPKIVVFFIGQFVGLIAGHAWWPAKATWKRMMKLVKEMGPPHLHGDVELRVFANRMWHVYRGR